MSREEGYIYDEVKKGMYGLLQNIQIYHEKWLNIQKSMGKNHHRPLNTQGMTN